MMTPRQARAILLVALLAVSALAAPAGARERGVSLACGLLAGLALSDPRLADLQWDVAPHPAWGAQVLLGRGRLAAGARLWRTQTTQRIDLPGLSVEPAVGLASVELVGMGRLASFAGTELLLSGSAGRLHLAYDPDQITIPPSGPQVAFAPVNEWIGGGGLALRRPLGSCWSLGLGVEGRFFGLDTAHRSGPAIVYQRETLGDWSARLELARLFLRH